MIDSKAMASGDLRPSRPQLGWMIVLSLFSSLFAGAVPRIVPGGSFISVIGDVLPIAAALTAIRMGLLTFRGRVFVAKLVAMIFLLLATHSLSRVIIDVYSFWNRPCARGALLGL